MLKISLTTSGLLDKSTLEAWARQKRTAIHQAVATGMRAGGKEITEAVRHQMRRDFSVKKPAFVNSLRPKVYDRNPDKLPALLIGSRIPWLGIHVRGGTLSGRMLIPLTEEGRRIGRRAFKRAERHRTGAKSIRRGQEIPIAVLVPKVTLKRRFDFEGAVRGQLPNLARAIEKELNRI